MKRNIDIFVAANRAGLFTVYNATLDRFVVWSDEGTGWHLAGYYHSRLAALRATCDLAPVSPAAET